MPRDLVLTVEVVEVEHDEIDALVHDERCIKFTFFAECPAIWLCNVRCPVAEFADYALTDYEAEEFRRTWNNE